MYIPKQELTAIGFKEKEINKVTSFVSIIAPVFQTNLGRLDEVVDLCSGNGLCSFIFISNDLANRATMYDLKRTNKFIRLQGLFKKHGLNYEFNQQDITYQINLSDDKRVRAIISIHPCSELGDKVIDIGLKYQIPFALMTCCHKIKSKVYNLKNPPDSRLMLYEERADYLDLVRKRYIEEQDWKCFFLEIPKIITEKNHILIGYP